MDELQSLFVDKPEGLSSSITYVQGTMLSWNPTTGANVVALPGGTQLTNVKILTASIFTNFTVGDAVSLILVNNQYTIMGHIKSAGAGLEQIVTGVVTTAEACTSASMTDLTTFGPQVTTYVGPARRVLVWTLVRVISINTEGFAGPDISGASTISVNAPAVAWAYFGPAGNATTQSGANVSIFQVFTASDGLNQGMNTFTLKYSRGAGAGGSATFQSRKIMVMPF